MKDSTSIRKSIGRARFSSGFTINERLSTLREMPKFLVQDYIDGWNEAKKDYKRNDLLTELHNSAHIDKTGKKSLISLIENMCD